MSSSTSSEVESQSCIVEIDSRSITYESLNDALLLKITEHARTNGLPPLGAAEADRIAKVLVKQGLIELADAVAGISPPRFSTEE